MPTVQPVQSGGGQRRRRGARVSTSLSEINVVPLVDVMLVMLVIFMVTAPMMQRGLDVSLPEARRADPISAERVFVTVPLGFRTDGIVQINEESVRFEQLGELIQQALAGDAGRSVFLRGDGEITYQELMDVMDALRAGGVEEVGLIAALPTR